jgi:hypothetical protein
MVTHWELELPVDFRQVPSGSGSLRYDIYATFISKLCLGCLQGTFPRLLWRQNDLLHIRHPKP